MNSLNQTQLLKEAKNTFKDFDNSLSRFSKEILNEKPFEGSWSAGQVAEHITKSNEGILHALLHGKIKTTERAFDQEVKSIIDIFSSQEKMQSAKHLEPTQKTHHLDLLNSILDRQKLMLIETIKVKDLHNIIPELPFPPNPDGLTRNEWIHLLIVHANRHKNQIDNIYSLLSDH